MKMAGVGPERVYGAVKQEVEGERETEKGWVRWMSEIRRQRKREEREK